MPENDGFQSWLNKTPQLKIIEKNFERDFQGFCEVVKNGEEFTMPAALERKLKREAAKHKNWSQEHKDRYVYGAMRATGWKPSRESQVPKRRR